MSAAPRRLFCALALALAGAAQAATLSVTLAHVLAGASVTVTWDGIENPTALDWLTLAPVGSDNTFYNAWRRTGGAASGSVPFVTQNAGPGMYELRLFSNNGYTRLATSQPFALTPPLYPVTGTVTSGGAPLAGVTFGGGPGTYCDAPSNAQGQYTCSVPASYTGTIAPMLAGYAYTPASRSYTGASGATGQDYTAVAITFSVSGTISAGGSALAGVALAGTNGASCGGTNAQGQYTCTVPYNYTGSLTPSFPGDTMTPAARSYSNVIANQSAQDYSAAPTTYTVSGAVTLNGTALSGVSFNAGSGTSCSVSDAAGQYSCTVPWSYTDTITPSKAGYLFTPGWTSYTHVQANQGALDYRAQAVTPSGVAGTVYYIQGDHLDTPRSMTDQSGNEVWRWDNTEPFGDSAPNDDPNNTGSHVNLPVGLSLYYGDKETGQRYAQRRDCYDPVTGRFCQSDPIGLLGGINTYGYASSDPVRIIDPLGLETIVIVNGKTSGNPFGHTAIATTGSGLYSPGNNPNASNNNYEGASVTSYLEEQAQRRDTTVFILPTLPQQERAINDYMKAQTSTPNAFPDNCASRVGDALQAGGVTLCDPFIPRLCLPTTPVPETLRRGLQQLESDGVARSVSIPRNGSVPSFLQSFNPK